MATFDAFIGESYTSRSLAFDAQRSMNLYLEADESGGGKSPKALLGTPGLALFGTLPTSPVRGIWTGLIDNLPGETGPDQCFVVAGSKVYQVFSGTVNTSGTAVTWVSGSTFPSGMTAIIIAGTSYTIATWNSATSLTLSSSAGTQTGASFWAYWQRGDVGTDATNSPVQFAVNGGQLLMASAGVAWILGDLGIFGLSTAPVRTFFNDGLGTCSTSGTAVTWINGSPFDASMVGSQIYVGSTSYVISAFTDASHITLATSAGTQTSATFLVTSGTATVDTSGTAVTAVVSGNQNTGQTAQPFTGLMAGDGFVIGTTVYAIASVTSGTALTLTASAGTQSNAAAQFAQPVLAAQVAFLDSYFIALPPASKIWYLSAIDDGTNWSALDFASKSAYPDAIAAVLVDHEEIWLFGSETSEIWRNTGAATFPFQRDPGAFVHQGCRAPYSIVNLANGVAWIGGDTRGNPVAWMAAGYIPQRISTHAIEQAWGEYETVADAVAFVYVQDGHQFWVISFPTANATWVWDATAGAWHERGWWNGTGWDRVRYATHGYVFGQHLTGDWSTGNLYRLSLDVYTDNGTAIHRRRTAPHLSNEELWTFYARFRLAMQGGSSAPNPTLSWSDDLGVTFNTPRAGSARRISSTSDTAFQMSEWRRLGRARDRVFSVDIADAAQIALMAAYLDLAGGNS